MKRITLFIVLVILLSFIYIPTPAKAMTVTVTLSFDEEYLTHTFSYNNSNDGLLWGNITCVIDAQDAEYKYVKVRLNSRHTEWWGPNINNECFFSESGVKQFSLYYEIPADTPNQTRNDITIMAKWYVENYYGPSKLETEGEATPDTCTLVVNKTDYPRGMETISGVPGETGNFLDAGGPLCLIGLIVIPIMIGIVLIIIIIKIYKKRKKNKEEIVQ